MSWIRPLILQGRSVTGGPFSKNNNTPSNVPGMSWTIQAGIRYLFYGFIYCDNVTSSAPGGRFVFTKPSGGTILWSGEYHTITPPSAVTGNGGQNGVAVDIPITILVPRLIQVQGSVVAATSGTMFMQFAQSATSAANPSFLRTQTMIVAEAAVDVF